MKKLGVALAVGLSVFGASRIASAFCGFYVSGADAKLFNDATQVALMREGTRTALSMQNSYKGPPENFAMVVPVPVVLQKENVKTLKKELFEKLDKLSAPRLVEYWEQDPCMARNVVLESSRGMMLPAAAPPSAGAGPGSLGVKIEAQFTVGEYEIVILSAKDSGGLDTWLRQQSYKIPAGAEPYLRPYVQAGSKFFVARVDVKKVTFVPDGHAELSPLRFHYDTSEFSLPVRLGLINSSGTQDLIVHILGKGQRYEPANYPSVTIPTNLDLAEGAKESFGAFYATLFDRTLEKKPKAIVTEYAWDASTCDPCPGPTLDGNDLASLGADVMPSSKPPQPPPPPRGGGRPIPPPIPPAPGAPPGPRPGGPMPPPPPPGGLFIQPWGWTLTRLHARYSKDTLGADIVFKAAPPIAGGREVRGPGGALEHGAIASPVNNFQGRYAMRHAWTGPIACENPQRGIWGGPPAWLASAGSQPVAATKTAYAPRGAQLAMSLRTDIPELDVKAAGPAPSGVGPAPSASAPPPPEPADAGAPLDASAAPTVPAEPPKSGGCAGCTTSTSGAGDAAAALAAIATVSMLGRRRRRAR
jgi:hypothetical protein